MYSYEPPHMAKQKEDDQLELTYSSYARTQDETLKTCQRRWIIGRSSERGSGISVLAAQHDDDDDDFHQMSLSKEITWIQVRCTSQSQVVSLILTAYCVVAQSAEVVEYTNCTSADGLDPNEYPGYDTKQSDGKVPVMLGPRGIRSTLSLPLLPGPL